MPVSNEILLVNSSAFAVLSARTDDDDVSRALARGGDGGTANRYPVAHGYH